MIKAANFRTLFLTLLVGVGLMGAKFLAFFLTGSNSILSDALESIVNVLAGAMALYSIWYSLKPRDANHPYGHGKIEYVSSGVEGALIISAGAVIIYTAIMDLLGDHQVEELGTGTLIVAAGAIANLIMGTLLIRQGRKRNSVVLEANGKHLLSDSISTWGILFGLVIILLTDLIWLDNLFAMVFGLVIIVIGLGILRKSLAGVMDEVDLNLTQKLLKILTTHRKAEWIDFHNFRIVKFGMAINVDCHMTLPWYWEVERAHAEVQQVEQLVNKNLDQTAEFFIHVDPCKSANCQNCEISDCHVRQAAFTKKVEWKVENVLPDSRHLST